MIVKKHCPREQRQNMTVHDRTAAHTPPSTYLTIFWNEFLCLLMFPYQTTESVQHAMLHFRKGTHTEPRERVYGGRATLYASPQGFLALWVQGLILVVGPANSTLFSVRFSGL